MSSMKHLVSRVFPIWQTAMYVAIALIGAIVALSAIDVAEVEGHVEEGFFSDSWLGRLVLVVLVRYGMFAGAYFYERRASLRSRSREAEG